MHARVLGLIGALASAACGSSQPDQCARAVDHVLALTVQGPVASEERRAIDTIRRMTLAKCRQEGLSPAQADCIVAARGPEWADQLRTCPAFAARPSSWVMLGLDRDARIRRHGGTPSPDGPRHGPVTYRELVGGPDTTCGVTDAGALQCWGAQVPVPDVAVTHLRWVGDVLCGLDRRGLVTCGISEDVPPDVLPTEPLADFDAGRSVGCGIRARDGTLVCWKHHTDAGLATLAPAGPFTQVVVDDDYACALTADGQVTCFGVGAPTPPAGARVRTLVRGYRVICGLTTAGDATCWSPDADALAAVPPGPFTALACHKQCCGVRSDRSLACWGPPYEQREPPAGSFTSIAVFRQHACAVRADGGTECWGSNDAGQCNVPQDATGHRWY
ncbi:MAG: RCC1 domain-containing protein [Myxococcota bacterium]|nr:RCC1 domain-containing protein [Myxococcota bacterium]